LLAPVIDRPPLTTVTLGLMGGRRIKVFWTFKVEKEETL
jgi:hypothetical protein